MNWPPLIMRLRIKDKKHNTNLWLPIFLAYPFLLAIALVLTPFVLIAALILWPRGWGKPLLLSGYLICRVLWALRGLEVDIRQNSERLQFYLK